MIMFYTCIWHGKMWHIYIWQNVKYLDTCENTNVSLHILILKRYSCKDYAMRTFYSFNPLMPGGTYLNKSATKSCTFV